MVLSSEGSVTAIVVDTSAVLASRDESQPQHAEVAATLTESGEDLLISPFVVAESDYMLATRLGHDAAREFLEDVAAGAYELVDFVAADVASANGVIDRYPGLHIGIADASLVVIAARYETTRLLTFDERHFRTVAPLWGGPAFTLLPSDG
jgi:predicted nucleic acid-binding protein